METDSNEFGQEDSEGRIVQDQLQNLIVREGEDFARFGADRACRPAPVIKE